MLAEIILDKKGQHHGVFSILSLRLNERSWLDVDILVEHLCKRRTLKHQVIIRLYFISAHQKAEIFDHVIQRRVQPAVRDSNAGVRVEFGGGQRVLLQIVTVRTMFEQMRWSR